MKLTDYIQLIRSFEGEIVPFPAMKDDPGIKGKRIYLRHDIDLDLKRAMDMAELEHKNGIRSAYFFLNTAGYWDAMTNEPGLFEQMGHEVGWHNNALSQFYVYNKGKGLKDIIEEPLKVLREQFGCTIRGTASHGDNYCASMQFINYHAFGLQSKVVRFPIREDHPIFNLSDFQLEYEAYFLKRNFYLSDSSGHFEEEAPLLLGKFNSMQDCTIQILCHPNRWE